MSNQKNKYFNLLYKRNRRRNGFTGGGGKKRMRSIVSVFLVGMVSSILLRLELVL